MGSSPTPGASVLQYKPSSEAISRSTLFRFVQQYVQQRRTNAAHVGTEAFTPTRLVLMVGQINARSDRLRGSRAHPLGWQLRSVTGLAQFRGTLPRDRLTPSAPGDARRVQQLLKRLKEAMRNGSRDEVEELRGASKSSISRLLRDESWSTPSVIARLEQALGRDLRGDEHRSTHTSRRPACGDGRNEIAT